MTREERQREAVQACLLNKKGIIILPTGVGKSRIGAYLAQRRNSDNPEKKSLIIVPTITLRDVEWVKTFEKFKYSKNGVDIICVQSLKNTDLDLYDRIIADEMHLYQGYQFSSFLSADAQIYGLTATLRDEGRDFFESNGLPVVYELSVSQCLEDGFLNPFVLINIGLDLSESEQKIYDDISTSISKEEDRIKAAGRTVGMVFGRSFYSKFENALFKKYRQYVHMRKKLLYTSTSKVKKLVDIVVQEDKKIIVFGESVDMVDQVFEYLKSKLDYDNQRLIARYHSKMSSKQRDAILDEFRNSTNGILISAKALKQGVDIPDCSVGIIVSRTRNSNDAAQQLGRIVRKAEGKEQSKLYNLYIRNTKDEEWSKLALADFKDYEINY